MKNLQIWWTKNIDNINFKLNKIQKYFIYYLIYKNKEIDNPTLIQNFKNIAKNNLDIS